MAVSSSNAETVVLALTVLFLNVVNSESCGTFHNLYLRANASFTVYCKSVDFNTFTVIWHDPVVVGCAVVPTLPGQKSVTISGGCGTKTVDANVTLSPTDRDKNNWTVYCEYGADNQCSDDYSLFVYDSGTLGVTAKMQTSSGTQASASWNATGSKMTNQLTVQPDSSARFNFTCSFTQCGSSHEARFAWFINSSSATPVSGFTSWPATDSSSACSYSDTLDVDGSTMQFAGKYAQSSYASWSASAFLQAAFGATGSSPICSSSAASKTTVKVSVGCVTQYKINTNATAFVWTNDTVNDAVWSTIVFTCPPSVDAASSAAALSNSEIVGIIVGIIIGAVVVTAVTCVIVRARRSRLAHEAVSQDDRNHQNNAANNNSTNNGQFEKKSPPVVTA